MCLNSVHAAVGFRFSGPSTHSCQGLRPEKVPNSGGFNDPVPSGGVKGEGKKAAGLGDPKKGSERSSRQISP